MMKNPFRNIADEFDVGWFRRLMSWHQGLPFEDSDSPKSSSNSLDFQRRKWKNRWEYYLSCLGYAIGLGNIWRFPYLAYSFGGAPFVIAYMAILVLIGIPLVLMEMALGQYSGKGPVALFRSICPLFGGLGYAIILNQFFICTYYAVILAWSFFYLFGSFTADLPWTHCGLYSSPFCFSDKDASACWRLGGIYQGRCYSPGFAQYLNLPVFSQDQRTTSAEEYFNHHVLQISPSISDPGSPNWRLVLCLLLAWTTCFLCVFRGIQSSGKVVWVTTLLPLGLLVAFAVQGLFLRNAFEGVWFYLVPDLRRLTSLDLWIQAAAQVFFNLSIGGGGLITYSSFNEFSHNFYFDAVTISLLNGLTSFLAGLAVFSALGFMSQETGLPFSRIVRDGPGLAFVTYPDAISRIPLPTLWAILFNIMLLCLGLDTLFAIIETIVTGICETAPKLVRYRTWLILSVCSAAFLFGILFTTGAGLYWVKLLDYFVAGWPLILFGFLEILIVLVYGLGRLSSQVTVMTGHAVNRLYKALWCTLVPVVTLGLVLAEWITHKPVGLDGIIFPAWAQRTGWTLAVLPLLLLPGYLAFQMFKRRSLSSYEALKDLVRPTPEFHPQSSSAVVVQMRVLPDIASTLPVGSMLPALVDPSEETHV